MKRIFSLGFFLSILQLSVIADQPIMSEVPRWDGGYGIQVFREHRWSNELRLGSNKQNNPNDLTYNKQYTHIEGVYTWHKWIRFTFKLPYVEQKRKTALGTYQSASGFDDIRFALPLKKYFNKPGYSGNYGFVPQVRMMGDDKGPYPISDGSTDPGFSIGYEYENVLLKVHLDLTYWFEQDDAFKDELYFDMGLGWNFHDQGNMAIELDYQKDEDYWTAVGPAFFWNFNDIILSKVEYKHPVYEYRSTLSISRGRVFRLGVGAVF